MGFSVDQSYLERASQRVESLMPQNLREGLGLKGLIQDSCKYLIQEMREEADEQETKALIHLFGSEGNF